MCTGATLVPNTLRFVQQGELRALGVTRALIWQRDVPTALADLLPAIGVTESKAPSARVHDLFAAERELLEVGRFRSK